jgi:hypothetical protein
MSLSADVIYSLALLAEAAVLQYAFAYAMDPKRHSLHSWFVRTPEEPRDPKKIKELKQFLMDLVLAIFLGLAHFQPFGNG